MKKQHERVLLNLSNLHIGGGIQVASSVIHELSIKPELPFELEIWASTSVDNSLKKMNTNLSKLPFYKVINSHGLSLLTSNLSKNFKNFSAVFTLFGPLYTLNPLAHNITGFAQAWIIYPNNEFYTHLPIFSRIKLRFKYWIQGYFFKRADVLVVELEHVKNALIRTLGIPSERIHVIRNCISSIYLNDSLWEKFSIPKNDVHLRLGFLGRNYPHKNTSIFPNIAEILHKKHGLKVRFYVTFTDEEWKSCTPAFRAACINVGPLAVTQCPNFYKELDGVVFPSLLECFSATPLEAMAMEKPLFASDLPFIRDICDKYAYYFNPYDPASAALEIARVFNGTGPDLTLLGEARIHAFNFSNPRSRAEKYLELLNASLSIRPSLQ